MENNLLFSFLVFIAFVCCEGEPAVQKLLPLLYFSQEELGHAKIRACKCIEMGKILLSRSEEAFGLFSGFYMP